MVNFINVYILILTPTCLYLKGMPSSIKENISKGNNEMFRTKVSDEIEYLQINIPRDTE